MAIPTLAADEIRSALKELEQAVCNHDQWAETLYGTGLQRVLEGSLFNHLPRFNPNRCTLGPLEISATVAAATPSL